MSDPDRLPDDVHSLLDAERELEAPSVATRARMFERLAPFVIPAAIGAGAAVAAKAASAQAASDVASATTDVAGSTAANTVVATAASTAAAGLKAKAVIALIAATLGGVGGAATHAALAPNPTPVPSVSPMPTTSALANVSHTAAAPIETAPMNTIVASSSATNDVQQTPTDSARPEAATSTDAPRGKQPAAGSSLRDERLLLERATAALVRGDSASALATLREHSRRFPRGGLAEEREVLFIRALRASGDEAAAQQRTERFKGEFPSSLQRGIIDAPASK